MGANRQPVLGHIDCPVCGHQEMQVKLDKNGDASGYCPDCSQQLFTRNPHKSKLLLNRMRPVAAGQAPVDLAPQEPAPVAVPVFLEQGKAPQTHQAAPGATKATPDKETPAPAAKTAPAPVPAVQVASWLRPLMSKGAQHAS